MNSLELRDVVKKIIHIPLIEQAGYIPKYLYNTRKKRCIPLGSTTRFIRFDPHTGYTRSARYNNKIYFRLDYYANGCNIYKDLSHMSKQRSKKLKYF